MHAAGNSDSPLHLQDLESVILLGLVGHVYEHFPIVYELAVHNDENKATLMMMHTSSSQHPSQTSTPL